MIENNFDDSSSGKFERFRISKSAFIFFAMQVSFACSTASKTNEATVAIYNTVAVAGVLASGSLIYQPFPSYSNNEKFKIHIRGRVACAQGQTRNFSQYKVEIYRDHHFVSSVLLKEDLTFEVLSNSHFGNHRVQLLENPSGLSISEKVLKSTESEDRFDIIFEDCAKRQ